MNCATRCVCVAQRLKSAWYANQLVGTPFLSVIQLYQGFRSNYFDLESDVVGLIDSVRNDITTELTVGSKFSRARIGVKDRLIFTSKYSDPPSSRKIYQYLPFSQKDIDRPPIQIATEGRLNRDRVSILYLASDKDTAVAELRPASRPSGLYSRIWAGSLH